MIFNTGESNNNRIVFIEVALSNAIQYIPYPKGFTVDNTCISGVINYGPNPEWAIQGTITEYNTQIALTNDNIKIYANNKGVRRVRFMLQRSI